MRKTSLYLDDDDAARLRRLAEREKRSQADVVRSAIAEYELAHQPPRRFALAGAWHGDGSSIADVSEEEQLADFGR